MCVAHARTFLFNDPVASWLNTYSPLWAPFERSALKLSAFWTRAPLGSWQVIEINIVIIIIIIITYYISVWQMLLVDMNMQALAGIV